MVGDISKGLVARVREYLEDSDKKKIKADILIYDKLAFYQDYIMTTKLVSRVKVTYPLITDQSDYPFLANVVQHTDYSFNEDIETIPARIEISNTTSGGGSRQWTFSDSDTFRTGTDFFYTNAYVRPTSRQKISATTDPILATEYHELLIEYTCTFFQTERRFDMLQKQTDEIAQALRSLNRFEAMPVMKNSLNFF